MSDIKEVLATAFVDEPPLAIDKPALIKAGKRGITTRYAFVGLAAVAAAVVVIVPAVTMPGGGGGGPDVGRVSVTPPSVAYRIPSSDVKVPTPDLGPATAEHAAKLTELLRTSGAIPGDFTPVPPPATWTAGNWEFEADGSDYQARAEMFGTRGSVQVWMRLSRYAYKGCEESSFPTSGAETCEQRTTDDGREYKVESAPDFPGVPFSVILKLPDGNTLMASSTGIEDRSNGPYTRMPGAVGEQPLTMDELVKLATVPGLVF
ncbi:hypothetical protein ADK67_00325 [Saccharothrix sp. NRRL B-16348]|uniref:hypothetical protein n=1 Tax=Saccharothrix sp. NRRL B-16348 TaxID=1415542 RepID=UPI0006AFBC3C|nr:hypothetical protein [Saccharothrix sp. NRRL B-16348]KOX35031.1 hypothetical protein ADK67_00325 [Saccharothrix sp. NRRL B-16348]